MTTDDDRDTLPPPPPGDWRQELISAVASVQDESGELMVLFGRMYTRAASLGAALARLGKAVSKVPPV
jgi:hypothetical protein